MSAIDLLPCLVQPVTAAAADQLLPGLPPPRLQDLALAFSKLLELGMPFLAGNVLAGSVAARISADAAAAASSRCTSAAGRCECALSVRLRTVPLL